MAVFDRGDVVSVPLDPAMGHEQKGTRPALVWGRPRIPLVAGEDTAGLEGRWCCSTPPTA